MTETVAAPSGQQAVPSTRRTKLIEVALPLEAINAASAREKSIRHGHPSTLHLWWARRPLAACRAVLFAQLVDDPSAVPEEFPTEEAQEAERQRLFRIIENLVVWENSTREEYLMPARREIARSVARSAGVPGPETDDDVWRILREHAPPVLDPFCGGGSIPLEAQRLGLETHASDLNPVAVLITKALIEIPPKFAGMPPVNPRDRHRGMGAAWKGAAGLAADVRYYGEWMREEAFKRIGHLYPKVKLPDRGEATVIAWLWARTVKCPNPACGAQMPLVRSFALSTKKGKETWVEPIVDREARTVCFEIRSGKGRPPDGTMANRAATCLVCETSVPLPHIRTEAQGGRMGTVPLAIVAEGGRQRVYVAPNDEQALVASAAQPAWKPEEPVTTPSHDVDRLPMYGMPTWGDAFTPRQLVALTTFSDLVDEAREQVLEDARTAGMPEGEPLHEGGNGAAAYADAAATYLAFAVDRLAESGCSLARWQNTGDFVAGVFSRQAIAMLWDFAEVNPFSESTRNFLDAVEWVAEVVEALPAKRPGEVRQQDAATIQGERSMISTDPPYYDNVGYADLSDFFYVWLRRTLRDVYPNLFRTMLVPKAEELVATPYRFGGNKDKAQQFFEAGLRRAFDRTREIENQAYPLAVYYAFRQTESDGDGVSVASTGWETMLSGLLQAGLGITGTWPMRTERGARTNSLETNALASSIVLVCRSRSADARPATRRELVAALRSELPSALGTLQRENIAPVDLAQASIGPGMAVFSRYSRVLEADGSAMSVRTALQIINQELDAYLAVQEGEMDADTRFCVAWFGQYGLRSARYGEADVLARAKDTSVEGLVRAGVLDARGGNVRLLARSELDADWNPLTDRRLTLWECAQHLIRALQRDGEDGAARLARLMGSDRAQQAHDLAYRLFAICERNGWAEDARTYNELAASWSGIQTKMASAGPEQGQLV